MPPAFRRSLRILIQAVTAIVVAGVQFMVVAPGVGAAEPGNEAMHYPPPASIFLQRPRTNPVAPTVLSELLVRPLNVGALEAAAFGDWDQLPPLPAPPTGN